MKDMPDYKELPATVRTKCEGREIFKGDTKFLSEEQYTEYLDRASQPSDNPGSNMCRREVTFDISLQDDELSTTV